MHTKFLFCLVALCLSLLITTPVNGHGNLNGPFPPRNVVTGLTCPHCANGGGPCGEGGQWLAPDEASDLNGSFTTPIHSIRGGDSLEFSVFITAPHQGHFVVELCKPTGNKITHDCFNTRLKRDPSDTRYSPYVPEYPDIAIFQDNRCADKSDQKVHFLVPSDVGDCEHCVLRWFWQTGNSCTSHPMTSSASTTDAIRQWKSVDGCGVAITGMGSCGTNCPTEACANEQFKNCIDVKITSSGGGSGGNTQAPPPSTQTSSSSSSSSSSNNNMPSGCASWNSLSPEYVQWCRETACPLCDSMKNDAAQYKACLDHSQEFCTTGDSTPAPTDPECASWTGKTSSNDAYCKATACPYCHGLDGATREACFESQKAFCNIS